jgi:hypothetical protein
MTESQIPPELSASILDSLRFQRKWQRISSSAYVVTTVSTLLCTSGATLAAAAGQDFTAAVFAAVSTVLIGLEKSLLFREKWKFHLSFATRLFVLSTKIATSTYSVNAIADEYEKILSDYPANLPIAGREV